MNNIFGEKWTDDELDFLIKNYEKIGPSECSKKIKRTIRGCQLKAKKLGLKFKVLKHYYEKDFLTKIISESNSYSECFRKIGISNRPGNYDTIKKYVSLYKIDTSHFYKEKTEAMINHMKLIKRPLSEILVENSSFSRQHLKERLFEEKLKVNVCELCGQDDDWNGRKMSMILDHINGVNNDNRIENLRILCPNCNSTLDTHCRGRKQKMVDVAQ